MSEPQIDIRPDHWAIVRDILQRHVPQYAVWAFGSRAKWTAKEFSDLDLAIITDSPLPLTTSAALAEDFSESDLPWKVDIVDWAETSETFRKIIERDRVVVQEALCSDLAMASEWKTISLSQIFKVKHGFAFKGEYFTDEVQDTVLVTPGNFSIGGGFQDEKRKYYRGPIPQDYVLKPGDIVVTMTDLSKESDTLGYAARIPNGEIIWLHNQRVGLLEFNKYFPVSSRFVQYLLRTHEYRAWIVGSATGTTVKHTSPSRIESFVTRIPPIEEQRAIAHILSTLDDRIELNRRMNETLEAMARSLFNSWFVNFDSVSAQGMQESERKPIPKKWSWEPVSKLIEFNPTEPLRKGMLSPYLDMAALPTVGSWPEPPILREYSSGMRFRNGDTLLARITPCLENGKTAFIQCLPENTLAWGSTEFIVMRPVNPVPAEYAYLLARDKAFRNHAIQSMTGTSGRQRVQAESIAQFKVAYPDNPDVWQAFAESVSPLFRGIRANAESTQALTQLRDTLLPKLISGEVRIKDAERLAETA